MINPLFIILILKYNELLRRNHECYYEFTNCKRIIKKKQTITKEK